MSQIGHVQLARPVAADEHVVDRPSRREGTDRRCRQGRLADLRTIVVRALPPVPNDVPASEVRPVLPRRRGGVLALHRDAPVGPRPVQGGWPDGVRAAVDLATGERRPTRGRVAKEQMRPSRLRQPEPPRGCASELDRRRESAVTNPLPCRSPVRRRPTSRRQGSACAEVAGVRDHAVTKVRTSMLLTPTADPVTSTYA